jgi:adenylate kinase family enzyme
VKLVEKRIATSGNRRYLIDGFPRNQENWDVFEK